MYWNNFGCPESDRLKYPSFLIPPDGMKELDALYEFKQSESRRLGCKNKHGCTDNPKLAEIQSRTGDMGEYSSCRLYGIKWEWRVNNFHNRPDSKSDIGEKTNVRTRLWWTYDLNIRPDDPSNQWFILCYGRWPNPRIYVIGHMMGLEAKKDKYWGYIKNNRKPAWWVPKQDVAPPPLWPTLFPQPGYPS
jgi:hypothetical protein